ncbi:MAG TPA: Crp/Fnr family transcriptional regulator [Chloroflexi bacterium]|nr:Crp/Fnr family transcriptional regulator [Chloroflexota bacterium]
MRAAVDDPEAEVRQAARAAQRLMAGESIAEIRLAAYRARRAQGESVSQRTAAHQEEDAMLSSIEKIIFLKKVPFFQDMTIEQLKSLAALCEEEIFEEDQRIFNQGDPGGALYMVVSGKVGIEQEAKRKGSFIRLASLGANTYFGEMTLFDNSARSAAAVALQDTLTLSLRHEPLVALARQNSELSLKLINVLSQRLRDANQQVAALTRAKPRALHKLYDALD